MSVLFRNATVIDGSGERPFPANVYVRGDTIIKVGQSESLSEPDAQTVDCTGRILLRADYLRELRKE